MRFILAFVFVLFFLPASPQQKLFSDSILQSYNSFPDDTGKVNLLYETGYGLRTINPKLAFEYAEVCLRTAEKLGSKKHLAKAYRFVGVLNYRTGRLSDALIYHKK